MDRCFAFYRERRLNIEHPSVNGDAVAGTACCHQKPPPVRLIPQAPRKR